VTTREYRDSVEIALKEGVDYYLIKPFHLNSLFEQLEKRFHKSQKGPQESKIQTLRSLSFVVVNLDTESRYKIQQLLLINGIQNVILSDSGTKALRVVSEKKVDVLIYDCNLLDVYWLDMKIGLEELEYPAYTPVLVVTSVSPVQKEFDEVRRAGLSAFVPGEIKQNDFFEAIFKALEVNDY